MWPFAGENPFNLCAEVIFHLRSLDSELFHSPQDRSTLSPSEKLEEDVDALFACLPTMCDASKLLRGIPAEEIEALRQWPYYNDFPHLLEFLCRFTLNLPYEKVLKSPYDYRFKKSEVYLREYKSRFRESGRAGRGCDRFSGDVGRRAHSQQGIFSGNCAIPAGFRSPYAGADFISNLVA